MLDRPVAMALTSIDGPAMTPARSSHATSPARWVWSISGGQRAHLAGDVLHLQIATVRKLSRRRSEDVGDRVADDLDRCGVAADELELFAGRHHSLGGHGARLQVVRTKAVALVLNQNLRHDAMETGFRHAVRERPTALTDAGRRLGITRAARDVADHPAAALDHVPDDRLHQQQLRRHVAVEPL